MKEADWIMEEVENRLRAQLVEDGEDPDSDSDHAMFLREDIRAEILAGSVPPARLGGLVSFAGKYDIVYADPPWGYYGDPNKNAAAGKHYPLMSDADIKALPVRKLFRDPKRGAAFVWATGPRLDLAIDAIRSWGLHYRGVAFVWVKTRRDGVPIGPRGVPPTATKPVTEMCLLATLAPRGRPFPLLSAKVKQVVLAPVGRHSEKPGAVRDRIVDLYGDRPRLEVFARDRIPGWDCWGNEAP